MEIISKEKFYLQEVIHINVRIKIEALINNSKACTRKQSKFLFFTNIYDFKYCWVLTMEYILPLWAGMIQYTFVPLWANKICSIVLFYMFCAVWDAGEIFYFYK